MRSEYDFSDSKPNPHIPKQGNGGGRISCRMVKSEMAIIDEVLLNEMTSRLVRVFHPDKVILFGSHAWGIPTAESDIDLYVIVPESSERPLQRVRRARACLEDVRVAKDILVRTRAEVDKYCTVYASLECQVLEKGRILYERR